MKILSVDGGGYLGLASAAFLEEVERHFGTKCYEHFDMFCGTSAGAIIALALATGLSAAEIRNEFEECGSRVFRNPMVGMRTARRFVGLFRSMYSNAPLAAFADRLLGTRTMKDLYASGKLAVVPAFCLTTGQPRVFKTDHAPTLSLHGDYKLSDVAMASASAPVYFPPWSVKTPTSGVIEEFCDGGVFANHPSLLGYVEAVAVLKIPQSSVSILSISTPRQDLTDHESAKGPLRRLMRSRGLISWASRLSSIFVDSASFITDQVVSRLVGVHAGTSGHYVRFQFSRPAGTDIDIADGRATETLRSLGQTKAQTQEARTKLMFFFGEGR